MIELTKSELDNIDFIKKVQILVNEIISDFNPKEIFLFKVDNWFDKKWLNFSGKVLGALGTWDYNENSRIPPFSPNRILEQGYYNKTELGNYERKEFEVKIHKRQAVELNINRRIVAISNSAVFIWYSSNTIKNGHGSLMIYPIENKKCDPIYVGMKKNKEWDIISALGINRKIIETIIERNKTPYNKELS